MDIEIKDKKLLLSIDIKEIKEVHAHIESYFDHGKLVHKPSDYVTLYLDNYEQLFLKRKSLINIHEMG